MPMTINPEKAYNKACNEYFTLFKRTDLTQKEKARVYYLFNRIDELEAVYFGNPKGLKICKACKRKVVKEDSIAGVSLKDICSYCYRNGGSGIDEGRINLGIGNRCGAKS